MGKPYFQWEFEGAQREGDSYIQLMKPSFLLETWKGTIFLRFLAGDWKGAIRYTQGLFRLFSVYSYEMIVLPLPFSMNIEIILSNSCFQNGIGLMLIEENPLPRWYFSTKKTSHDCHIVLESRRYTCSYLRWHMHSSFPDSSPPSLVIAKGIRLPRNFLALVGRAAGISESSTVGGSTEPS